MLALSVAVCLLMALTGVLAPRSVKPFVFGAMLPMMDFLALPGPVPVSGSLLGSVCLVLTTARPRPGAFLAQLGTLTGVLIVALIGYDLFAIGLTSSVFNGRFLAMPNSSLFRVDLAQPVGLVPAHFNQLMYLLVGCFAALCIGARFKRTPAADVVQVLDRVIVGSALSSSFFAVWQFIGLRGVPYPEALIHIGSRAGAFDQAIAGVRRLSGSYSEPSALGSVVGLSLCYLLARSPIERGARLRWIAIVGSVFCIVVSTSTTAIGMFAVALFCGGAAYLFRTALAASTGRTGHAAKEFAIFAPLIGLGVLGAMFVFSLPQTRNVLYKILFEKSRTSSFAEREASNTLAKQLFAQTDGLGIGLGGHVANSAWLTLAADLGIAGLAIVGFLVGRAVALPFLRGADPRTADVAVVLEARLALSALALGNAASMAISGANFGGITFWLMIGFSLPLVSPAVASAGVRKPARVGAMAARTGPRAPLGQTAQDTAKTPAAAKPRTILHRPPRYAGRARSRFQSG